MTETLEDVDLDVDLSIDPVCEALRPGDGLPCVAPARWRVTLRHLVNGDCGNRTALFCTEHKDAVLTVIRLRGSRAWQCSYCRDQIEITEVAPL